jgi:hypothetical protein
MKPKASIWSLFEALLLDIAEAHGHYQSDVCVCSPMLSSDLNKIRSEAGRENALFLTVTLPSEGKAFDAFLSGRGVLPQFSLSVLNSIVETKGSIGQVVLHVRQLSYLFYKYEYPYEPETAKAVIESFVNTDRDLQVLQVPCEDPIIRNASNFIASIFARFNPWDIYPKHGPGAVATGEGPHEKSVLKRVYRELDATYPFTEYMCFSLSHVVDELDKIEALECLEEPTAKVVLVPKDSRGPRLISCEPLEVQWIQQGLGRKIVSLLESHPLTRGHVNFTCQEVNRKLALQASIDASFDTLDMKDASDRVGLELVRVLFRHVPDVLRCVLACRSTQTVLPNGVLVRLNKFAPMGSALCFPIESLVFYALAVSCLQHCFGISRRKARKAVYVYGDDIIIKTGFYPALMEHFPRFGLRFNEAKCCTGDSRFRESCGMDAFNGVPVQPLRVKTLISAHLDPNAIASYVAYSNIAYARGFKRLACECEDYVRHFLPGVPYTNDVCGGLSFVRPIALRTLDGPIPLKKRYNKRLQRWEVLGYILQPALRKDVSSGWRLLLRRSSIGSTETELGLYAIPRRVKLTRGWVAT